MQKWKGPVISFVMALAMLGGLYVHMARKSNAGNGFRRFFIPHPIGRFWKNELKLNSYYLAGVTDGQVVLGNQTVPGYILSMTLDLNKPSVTRYRLPARIAEEPLTAVIDSNAVLFFAGNDSALITVAVGDTVLLSARRLSVPFFTALGIVKGKGVLLRSFNRPLKRSTLTWVNLNQNSKREITQVLVPHGDGYFSCDGSMVFDRSTHFSGYVYRFSNQILALDSALSLRWASTTIDTVSSPALSIASYKQSSSVISTYQHPPEVVNALAVAAGGRLFVQSKLRATNEELDAFDGNWVFDVYTEDQGKYQFSFYLPNPDHLPIKSLVATEHSLFLLAGTQLTRYDYRFD